MLTTNELRQFSGTEHWYRHLSGYLYTDGVQYVAQEGGAYWLIDKILLTTRAKNKLQEFGAWKLEVNRISRQTLCAKMVTTTSCIGRKSSGQISHSITLSYGLKMAF